MRLGTRQCRGVCRRLARHRSLHPRARTSRGCHGFRRTALDYRLAGGGGSGGAAGLRRRTHGAPGRALHRPRPGRGRAGQDRGRRARLTGRDAARRRLRLVPLRGMTAAGGPTPVRVRVSSPPMKSTEAIPLGLENHVAFGHIGYRCRQHQFDRRHHWQAHDRSLPDGPD